jgi:glycine/D-amino acid oxidase-like deaminating enzyme
VRAYVRQHLPALDYREPAIQEICMYTLTPDNEPFLDRFSAGIVVGCGFSGSGFKHSPATGHMLASLALEEESTLPEGYQLNKYALGRLPAPRHRR